MTLSGGLYGPAFVTEHTEKEWPVKFPKFNKHIIPLLDIIAKMQTESGLEHWLEESKFYGAEYYNDED